MNDPLVLVVDDDDSIREIAQLAIEVVSGWRVIAADGGLAALELASEHRPDVVLLDLMMPDIDGVTTFKRLREQESTREIPVILVTAKVQVGSRQIWDDLEVAGVIAKPFDPLTLGDQVAQMLGWEASGG